MTATTAILRHRRDTAANFTSTNPTLEDGQIGYETDTFKFKFGDGSTAWTGLAYAALAPAAIGTTVQAYDAELAAIAGLASAADRAPYFTGSGTASMMQVTSAGRDLLDDANAAAQLATLGLTTGYYYQRVAIHTNAGAGLTLTTHPSTQQFLGNSSRNVQSIDLTGYTDCRLSIRVTTLSASANTPRLRLRYRTAFSATVTDYSDAGTSEVSCSLAATGLIVSSWITIATSAKADVFLLVEQLGGDSSASPIVGSIAAEFRVTRYG